MGKTFILQAKDYRHSTCSKKIQILTNANDTAGLHHTIKIKTSMVIEICWSNLDILDGLVNEAEATCMGMTTLGHEEVIWVEFKDSKKGRETRQENSIFYSTDTPNT